MVMGGQTWGHNWHQLRLALFMVLALRAICQTDRQAESFLQHGIEGLDWDARLFQVPHFLSDAEADEMLDLGHGALTEKFGDEWFDKHAYSTVFFTDKDYARSSVLRAFEERVARLTMVKPHPQEPPTMFTRQIPGTAAGSLLPGQVLRNVHHDKNARENRVVTVLVYLSSARDGDGGHTLFPCLPARRNSSTPMSKRKDAMVANQMARDFQRLFDNGTRVIDDKIAPGMTASKAAEIDLLRRANEQCQMAQRSQVLSVRPTKGTAVVFWSTEVDGHPNHKVWHSACQALAGRHRYAIQKFKELPRVSGEWVLAPGQAKPHWLPRHISDEL